MKKKFTKPSQRKLVLNKKTNKWLTPEEDAEYARLEVIKRNQAKKFAEEVAEEIEKAKDKLHEKMQAERLLEEE